LGFLVWIVPSGNPGFQPLLPHCVYIPTLIMHNTAWKVFDLFFSHKDSCLFCAQYFFHKSRPVNILLRSTGQYYDHYFVDFDQFTEDVEDNTSSMILPS
jgi:hypothetical protein